MERTGRHAAALATDKWLGSEVNINAKREQNRLPGKNYFIDNITGMANVGAISFTDSLSHYGIGDEQDWWLPIWIRLAPDCCRLQSLGGRLAAEVRQIQRLPENLGNRLSGSLFDREGGGIRAATGWVGADDGFLVYDRNGNGFIDNGRQAVRRRHPFERQQHSGARFRRTGRFGRQWRRQGGCRRQRFFFPVRLARSQSGWHQARKPGCLRWSRPTPNLSYHDTNHSSDTAFR